MFNLLKADFYRTVRTAAFWGFAAFTVLIIFFGAGMMAFLASEEFEDAVLSSMVDTEYMSPEEKAAEMAEFSEAVEYLKHLPSLISTWDDMFLDGGFLSIVACMFLGTYLVRDFRSGFVKNLPMDRRGRLAYFAEKLVYALIVQVVFMVLAVVATSVAFPLFGFSFDVVEPVPDLAIWLGLAFLLSCAYTFVLVVAALWSRKEWLIVCWALLISTGIVGAFFLQGVGLLARAWPWLNAVPFWTLRGNMEALRESVPWLLAPNAAYPIPALTPAGQTVLVSLVVIAAAVVLSMTVCRKRDIK